MAAAAAATTKPFDIVFKWLHRATGLDWMKSIKLFMKAAPPTKISNEKILFLCDAMQRRKRHQKGSF